MKRKLLLGFVLTSILSANSFAMKITHGKLISHQEWTTGKHLHAVFKETDNLEIPELQINAHNMQLAQETSADADVDTVDPMHWLFYENVQGVVGEDIPLGGQVMVQISNRSPVSKNYIITTTLVTCFGDAMTICKWTEKATSQDTITLDAGGIAQIAHASFATEKYGTPGVGYYWLATDIQVDRGTIFKSRSNAVNITIKDNVKK
ncbi:MAG: hypothetical protein ABI597_10585 [Gammaproteobacteria bacterium]